MMIFDGHLDMAMNALDYERDQAWDVAHIRNREAAGVHDGRGLSTVSLPELRAGNTPVVLTTVIARCKPWVGACREQVNDGDWPAPSMSHAVGMGQLAYYKLLEARGELKILTTASALREHLDTWHADSSSRAIPGVAPSPGVGVILTMEGADPITTPEELEQWYALGLRTLMLAHFGQSRYAHGTPCSMDLPGAVNPYDVDGPLSDMGRQLLALMHRLGMPLDLTHTSDQTFAEAEALFEGRIYSSHTGCRAVCDIARNHSDEQLRAVIGRGGVIGLPMFNLFLKAGYERDGGKAQVPLAVAADHADHICQLAGNTRHVALGTDSDGGFGAEHMPAEIDTHRDLHKFADTLGGRGYSDAEIEGVMFGNWMRFFSETLPA